MSVKKLGDAFASDLHAQFLKPLGFRKSARYFSRQCDGYGQCDGNVEAYQPEGSGWNAGEEPWLFHLTVRVRFDDVPPVDAAHPLAYHAAGRIERLIPSAPRTFELRSENRVALLSTVRDIIVMASDALAPRLPAARARAGLRRFSPLPVPESWS
jgi:hypothetical protein